MKYQAKIVISQKDAAEADLLLSPCGVPPEDLDVDKRCQTCPRQDFQAMSWVARFPNRTEVEVKLCPGCPPWTEAVLSSSCGAQLAHTHLHHILFGKWRLEDEDDQYLVEVVRGDE